MLTLHRLHLGYRVLYTGVLVFMTAGTAVHTVHQAERGGIAPSAVADWYLGNEDDSAAEVLLFPKSAEEVWSDVWLHSATYTMAFVVLGSLLFRSGMRRAAQAALLGPFAFFALIAAVAPLLIRYGGRDFGWLLSLPLVVQPVLALVISAVVTAEMWFWRTAGMRFEPRAAGGHGGGAIAS